MIIEKNIPIPKKASLVAELDTIEVGDCALFPREQRNSIRTKISDHFHSETMKRFTVSCKRGDKVVSVWRIEDAPSEVNNKED